MADAFYLSDSDRQTLRSVVRWWRGGGAGKSSRPVPTRRRQVPGGGGGAAAAKVAGNIALATTDIPSADFNASGTDPFQWFVTPGIVGDMDVTFGPSDDGVLLLDWEREAATKEEYIDAEGVLAPYKLPFTNQTPVYELGAPAGDPPVAPIVPAWRAAVNESGTDVRASTGQPVVVGGYDQRIAQEDSLGAKQIFKVFVITSIFDMRALPGFVEGTLPEADAQAAFHQGGSSAFELGHGECEEP